jgi:hypothetical protein
MRQEEIDIIKGYRPDPVDEPAAGSSVTIGQVKECPVCAPILAFAHSLPPTDLPRALEIMRLTGLLYAEIHKSNKGKEQ